MVSKKDESIKVHLFFKEFKICGFSYDKNDKICNYNSIQNVTVGQRLISKVK